jgi:hypothetical protein
MRGTGPAPFPTRSARGVMGEPRGTGPAPFPTRSARGVVSWLMLQG